MSRLVDRDLVAAVFLALILVTSVVAWSQERKTWTPSGSSPTSGSPASPASELKPGGMSVEAAVINPYRSANVGTLVGGEIKKFHFDEGDVVREGQVVCELDTARNEMNAQRAEERLKAAEIALKRSGEEARAKRELFNLDATTRQEVARAETEAEMDQHRVGEARKDLEMARFDVAACKIKSPFSGHLAVRYKQPEETVERLERVFAVVDSSKVYAVANVPETQLEAFEKGSKAFFVTVAGKNVEGIVDKVGKLIDPKSRTKKVYVLIDNAGGQLEVGMTGTLNSAK